MCLFSSTKISFCPWISDSSLVVVGPRFCGRLLAVSLRGFRTWSSSSKNKRRLGLELLEAGKRSGMIHEKSGRDQQHADQTRHSVSNRSLIPTSSL